MKSNIEQKSYSNLDQLQVFKNFAESLKLPLLQIARSAELANSKEQQTTFGTISDAADQLNKIIESYLLSIEICLQPEKANLRPVTLSAALNHAAHAIAPQANKHGFDLELVLKGKYGPIMAHPEALHAALVSIGLSLINCQNQQTKTKRPVIQLAAHRTGHGVVAGLYTPKLLISKPSLRKGKQLVGTSSQPLSNLSSAPESGIFIAETLLTAMSTNLRVARFNNMTGLAATFSPSQQMELV